MSSQDVMKVCRLCLGTDSLTWIFDRRIDVPENLKEVIQVATGVLITPTDNVSQSVCSRCVHITTRMIKFRTNSQVNDNELKARAYMRSRPVIDKSVELLLEKYPRIKLPTSITKCNVSPRIILNKNEVYAWMEYYRKKRKIEKKHRKQLKMIAEKNNEMNQLNLDIEKNLVPHIIENRKPSSSISQDPEPRISPLKCQSTSVTEETSKHLNNGGSTYENNRKLDDGQTSRMELQDSFGIETQQNNAKRKLSLNLPKPKKHKPDDDRADDTDSLLTVHHSTKSLFVCDICSSISYSAKDLKKHKVKHMRCKLCKLSFSSLEETKEHCENNCEIKQMMTNLPRILLERCDKVQSILDQYRSAFNCHSKDIIKDIVIVPGIPKLEENVMKYPTKDPLEVDQSGGTPSEETCDIVIISDDESEMDDGNKEKAPLPVTSTTTNNVDQTKKEMNISVKKSNSEKKQESSTKSLKRNLTIAGEDVLDVNLDESDTILLKNILKRTRKNFVEKYVQTDMPVSSDITTLSDKNKLFELKNLRNYLNYNKIPVNLSYAPNYSVRYSFEPSSLLKKDRSWSKLPTTAINPSKPPALDNNKNIDVNASKAKDMPAIAVEATSNTETLTVSNNNFPVAKSPKINPLNNSMASGVNDYIQQASMKKSNLVQNRITVGVLTTNHSDVFLVPKNKNTFSKSTTQNKNKGNLVNTSPGKKSVTPKLTVPIPSTNYSPSSRVRYTSPSATTAPFILNFAQRQLIGNQPQSTSLPHTGSLAGLPPNFYYVTNNTAPVVSAALVGTNLQGAPISSSIVTESTTETVAALSSQTQSRQLTPSNGIDLTTSAAIVTVQSSTNSNQLNTMVSSIPMMPPANAALSPIQNNINRIPVVSSKATDTYSTLPTLIYTAPSNALTPNNSMPPPTYIPPRAAHRSPAYGANTNISQTIQIDNPLDLAVTSARVSDSPRIRVKSVSELS